MKRFTKATIISAIALLLIGVGGLAVWSLEKPSEASKQPQNAIVTPAPQPPTEAELLTLVNNERAKVGVAPLEENALLDQSAQWKANDEVTNNYFGHVKPGTTGNNGLDYLNSLHSPCVYISENLASNPDKSQITSTEAMYAWMHSTAHREAMLNPKYTLTGFGIVKDAVVEHFCQQ